jgi:ubiquitin-protein ligase/DNA-directed RNA polymerase subunit RPC12/RpoP
MSESSGTVQTLIEFRCPHCGRGFSVPGNYAGRKAKCKTCGGEIVVPQSVKAAAPASSAPKLSPRARRLIADAEQIKRRFRDCEWIKVSLVSGEPADTYEIEYAVDSLEHGKTADKPVPRRSHRVEIKLTGEYPRTKPMCRMLTPIFHPNIDTATICVGDHWTAGERLADLVIRIGEMLAYQAYNIQSPLDAEAAMWADLNKATLPLDSRNLHPPEV